MTAPLIWIRSSNWRRYRRVQLGSSIDKMLRNWGWMRCPAVLATLILKYYPNLAEDVTDPERL